MPLSKVVLYVSSRNGCAHLARECGGIFRRFGVAVRVPFEHCDKALWEQFHAMPEAKAVEDADAAVVIGGDGSILRAARTLAPLGIPILGVNMGRIGFMSELEPDELHHIEDLCRGAYSIEERMMLETTVIRGGECIFDAHSLNDVTVYRGTNNKLLELNIWSDIQFITKFRADGVIVATPTGATAYSLSAGGPIIEPTLHNMMLTPICAQGLFAKSYVLAPNRRVTLHIAEGYRGAVLTPDGQEGITVSGGDTICVCQSPYVTRLVRIKGKSVYDIIRDKLSFDITG